MFKVLKLLPLGHHRLRPGDILDEHTHPEAPQPEWLTQCVKGGYLEPMADGSSPAAPPAAPPPSA